MKNLNPKLFDDDIEQVPTRNGFGEGLVLAGDADTSVVALCADLTESVRMQGFKDKYPERFIEVGVAEQNLVTVASGLAHVGKIPFTASYATFSPGRNWEQIRTTICYNDVPVKIIGGHAGLSVGPDGATHQALEDVAIMRALPNMVVIVPVDAIEARKATVALAQNGKPTYLRLSRDKVPTITTEETPFEIGKAEVYFDSAEGSHKGADPTSLKLRGASVSIIACGQLVYRALKVAKELEKENILVRVINCHTIKPIDSKTILQAAEETGAIVTVEEHQITGGLGSAVAEVVSQSYPVPMNIIGVEDSFGESGKPEELMKKFGLTEDHIKKAVLDVVRRKQH